MACCADLDTPAGVSDNIASSLPPELLSAISKFMSLHDRISMAAVSHYWRECMVNELACEKALDLLAVPPMKGSSGQPKDVSVRLGFIKKLLNYLPNIETMDLSGIKVDKKLCRAVANKCRSIKNLILCDTSLEPFCLKTIAAKCWGIEKIDLQNNRSLDSRDLIEIFKRCQVKDLNLNCSDGTIDAKFSRFATSLTLLDIQAADVSNHCFKAILKNIKGSLQVLKMDEMVELNPELALCTHLIELDISGEFFDADGDSIRKCLPPNIEILRCSGWVDNDPVWSSMFDVCPRLSNVDLSSRLGSPDVAQNVLDIIASNSNIKVLDLHGCKLPRDLTSLCNSKVEKLLIMTCQVDDRIVIEMFKGMENLRLLDIRGCGEVTEKAFQVLLDGERKQQPEVHVANTGLELAFITKHRDQLNLVTEVDSLCVFEPAIWDDEGSSDEWTDSDDSDGDLDSDVQDVLEEMFPHGNPFDPENLWYDEDNLETLPKDDPWKYILLDRKYGGGDDDEYLF